jgi:hypothetical protein
MEQVAGKLIVVGVMVSAAIAAAGAVSGASVLFTGERNRMESELAVPGYAERVVKADRATWR